MADELFTFTSASNGTTETASFDGVDGNDTLDATFGEVGFATAGLTTSFTDNGDGTFSALYSRPDSNSQDSVSIVNVDNVFISVIGDDNGLGNEDFVQTGDGDDNIFTDNGADTIVAGKGVDTVDGGTSDEFGDRDTISKDFSDVSADISWNIQTGAFSGPGSFTSVEVFGSIQTGSGNDNIVSDTFNGSSGRGHSSFSTGAGDDTVTVFNGNDTVDAGSGEDTLIMDYETNNTFLGNNAGVLSITETSPGVYSGTLTAGVSSISVDFTGVENFVFLGHVSGGNEFDGQDSIQTGAGDDLIRTNEGNDSIDAGTGTDTVDGGEQGPDFDGLAKEFGSAAPAITFDLVANSFSGPGSYTNFEYFLDLRTGNGGDTIVTTDVKNTSNERGDDMITTRGGDDTITLQNGNDTVDGGGGDDRLIMDYATSDVFLGNGTSSTLTITETSPGTYSGTLVAANAGAVSVDFSGIESFVFRGHISGGNEFGGQDVITTGDGDDFLEGNKGNDIFDAGDGNDTLDGGVGRDTLTGGAGDDLFLYDEVSDSTGSGDLITDFQSGLDVIDISAVGLSNIMLLPDANGQVLTGTSGSDQFRIFIQGGAASGDILTGGAQINAGDDTFIGTDGNDFIDGGLGDDLLTGGLGDDTLVGSAGRDTLDGGVGQDRLVGSVREDSLLGGDGADTIAGNNNADYIDGGSGADRVLGGPGDDIVFGDTGSDLLNGNNGVDTINGGVGADTVNGGALADSIVGGAGADALRGNAGNDTIEGNTGGDSILGQANDDLLHGDANNDTVSGNGGNDSAFGGEGADLLRGNAGDDIVYGDDGADQLLGGNGDDVIVGGVGEDRLAGNNGRDVFIFGEGDSGASLASADLITDFSQSENDVIRLVGIDAITGGGDDAFDFVGTAAFSGTAGELRYEQSGGNTTVFGDTDGDGTADFALQLLGNIDLVAGDFVL